MVQKQMCSNQISMTSYSGNSQMKIMTINTHSYIENESEKKLDIFADAINRLRPDIIAMQEVNQRINEEAVEKSDIVTKQFGIRLKKDNYALLVAQKLFQMGTKYKMVWLGIKRGFEIFDEGLCFLYKGNLQSSDAFLISKTDDIANWKKRMALSIEIGGEHFFNVHMGRWDDEEEPFIDQWRLLDQKAKEYKKVWLMGDFNSPCDYKGEGYDSIISSNWYDTYTLAKNKDMGYTVTGSIDGWRDKKFSFQSKRIDYIFTNKKTDISSSYTVFNGENEQIISDHFGILLSYERK